MATANDPSADYDVVASASADRADPFELDGAAFRRGKEIYAFVGNADGGVANVEFILDGERIQQEFYPPWDIAGGTWAQATGFDTSGLAPGGHTLETRITYNDGSGPETVAVTDSFEIRDAGGTGGDPTAHPYSVVYSETADRSGARDIPDGLEFTRGESLYAFVGGADSDIVEVEFRLDGSLLQTERYAPYDVAGGTRTQATGLDTSDLALGDHTLEARITYDDGSGPETVAITDSFTLETAADDSVPSTGSSGSPQPQVQVPAGSNSITGSAGSETLIGTLASDRIEALAGNDTVYGRGGNDSLFGGPGGDALYGGDGDDFVSGGTGNDTLQAGNGDDEMSGGSGNDRIYVTGGDNRLFGDGGNDYIIGGAGAESLHGGQGADTLYGKGADDVLYGDGGDDEMFGDGGNDTLFGGDGADTVFGGAGDDTIEGGPGNGVLYYGAEGDDTLFGMSWGGEPVPALDPTKQVEPDEPVDDDDVYLGAEGQDTYVFRWLIDAKPEVLARNTYNGDIDYRKIAIDENDLVHDHWVETIGNDLVRGFNPSEDELIFEGHTVALNREESRYITNDDAGVNNDTLLVFHSVNMVRAERGLPPGAHEGDDLGSVIVNNVKLDFDEIADSIVTDVFYGVEEPYSLLG